MTLDDLQQKSILILGFGIEGQATYEFIRENAPAKPLIIADKRALTHFPEHIVRRIQNDPAVTLKLGPDYLTALATERYDVIVKTPGIPATLKEIVEAYRRGALLTSHSDIFLSNYPQTKVIGVTGTKGKSTTTALIHHILKCSGVPAYLVGNIGAPPLLKLRDTNDNPYFVHEFSSHQLAEITHSPHIAVLLNIVPEHLDYYRTFGEYVSAKENITRFQSKDDFLIFSADYAVPGEIAARTQAITIPCGSIPPASDGCYIGADGIMWVADGSEQLVIEAGDIPLPGKFNLQNVMAAAAATLVCGVAPEAVRQAVRSFQPLPHRIERVGTFNGITFYDDSIATVPEAALGALEALGTDVETLIMGGYDRRLEFDDFARKLPQHVRTLILFLPSGERILAALRRNKKREDLPEAFFVESMDEAVQIAYSRTAQGKICLLSPASPSFGTFIDYKERGEAFKKFITQFAGIQSGGTC